MRCQIECSTFVLNLFIVIVFVSLTFGDAGESIAMEIKNGQLKITTHEITLIWEHYCMKHIARKEWHLARLNKKAIEFQRGGKLYWNSSPDQLAHFQKKLEEAQLAKDSAGGTWTCNPPVAKLAFVGLKVGQCGEARIPESFISSSDHSIDTDAAVALIDSECNHPEIEWSISIPKYNISKTSETELAIVEESEEIVVASSGLSSDETVYNCRVEDTNETKKLLGSFTAVMGRVRCGYITYELDKTSSNLIGKIQQTLDIPKALLGDRGDDFRAEVEAKLFCDSILSDNVSANIKQNESDQLRQEYLDMGKQTVPERKELVSSLKTKNFNLSDFNSSQKVGGGKYSYILCKVLDKLESVRRQTKIEQMVITSGYRNPYKNARTPSSGKESQHIYGYAADIVVQDFNSDSLINKDDWDLLAESAKNNGACIEPYRDTGTWVHMDWRGTCPQNW